MHIILTHEQADFDALASLLGAYLLEDNALPVLPRRMNRNVRAFLTLYRDELPFVEARDLPAEPVEAVTLVDTQSLISVRGMSEATRVHVIDHHPLREDLPPNWQITVTGSGANTTLFVETLRERDLALQPTQATLLLMGIYEDTGSLTYDRTTARDLRAASYLLDQSASLQTASGYLNHPLSAGQTALYGELRQSARFLPIAGHNVVIACADAHETDEELSTIAHKLRDLLDPDALFLLAATRSGVQLIARSTNEDIDVAEVAAHFGGGGHDRAAAALVRDRALADVLAELEDKLPQIVRPAVTVAQIMSPGPQLLAPETPVEEAARRMQRYGHEGYPVVKGGKVIGLLTRRAVDRAISHRLNLTAVSLMEAGEFAARLGDSVEQLQRLMVDSGWGQMPVVNENGEIVGIVTRTDLLKTLTPVKRPAGRLNLGEKLEAALPPPRLALLKEAVAAANERRVALYIVGGFVRDLLLDRPSLDFDLVVEGDAIALAKQLAHRHGGRVTSHSRFGTAKWHVSAGRRGERQGVPGAQIKSLDLISARTEFYTHPTALPTVERSSIKLDLHRRDFTINTLALRLDGRHYGELHDYWGGLADLRRGLVRVLHSLSFVDDPTRILRAVRFEQRFGFRIEARTLDLLREAISLLDRVSGDRIRHELDHILDEEHCLAMLERLEALGLLRAIHPALAYDSWYSDHARRVLAGMPEAAWGLKSSGGAEGLRRELFYALWLMRLPGGAARSVINRLKLPSATAKTLLAARDLWEDLPGLRNARPSGWVARVESLPRLALYAVYLACDEEGAQTALKDYVTRWSQVTALTSGHDLRLRGIPPGPAYKQILSGLREAWLDGGITSPEEEEATLRRMIQEAKLENNAEAGR
ncbi:MAG: CBS domain-containing protein [Chloroflexi bacterium]|nr:CBS domain-containing protein [Chloroflexota bacterium]